MWGGKYVKLPLSSSSFVGENHVNCFKQIPAEVRYLTLRTMQMQGTNVEARKTRLAWDLYDLFLLVNVISKYLFPGFLEFGASKVNQTLECGMQTLISLKDFETFNGNHEAVEVWTYIGESPNFKHLRNWNKAFFKHLHLRFVETQQIG